MAPVAFGPRVFDAGLVIFDKDGTLFYFDAMWRPVYLRAVDALLAHVDNRDHVAAELHRTLGYDPPTQHFLVRGPFASAANDTVATVMAAVLYRHAQPPLAWDGAEALVRRVVAPILSAPPPPSALKTPTDLAQLFGALRAAGVRVAVITSDERAPTLAALGRCKVDHLVDAIITSDDGHPKKPGPEAVWAVCKQLDVSPARTAVVGDTLTDLEMAAAAGVGLRVAVLTGPGRRADLAPLAHVVLESIAQVAVGSGDRGEGE